MGEERFEFPPTHFLDLNFPAAHTESANVSPIMSCPQTGGALIEPEI